MKTLIEQFIEQLEEPKYQDEFDVFVKLTIDQETKDKFLAMEKEQRRNDFCAGWDKSKTALMQNKKNYYSLKYINNDESN